MGWSDISDAITKTAPLVGTLLGGPALGVNVTSRSKDKQVSAGQ